MSPSRQPGLWVSGLLVVGLCVATSAVAQRLSRPALRGHAHNDYLHPRPLRDALDAGFCSIEVDVFAIDGLLLVAHARAEIEPGRTLESLYLEPLSEIAEGGRFMCGEGGLLLLVDFKTGPGSTLPALKRALARYHLPSVRVVISGSRPDTTVLEADGGLALDGRLADLETSAPVELVPLISDSWPRHFSWAGEGPFPPDERVLLHGSVGRAHAQGRLVRFWAVPQLEAVWRELLDAGVDLVSVDALGAFAAFNRR